MKKALFVKILSLIVVSAVSLNASIWTLDNTPGNIANFNNITDAMASTDVVDGDTLYIAGSHISYGGMSLSKRLFIFGPGYWLSENAETQNSPLSATLTNILLSGSAESNPSGSLISGIEVTDYIRLHSLSNADTHIHDVTITRCKMAEMHISTSYSTNTVYNILISNCHIGSQVKNFVGTAGSNISLINNFIGQVWMGGDASLNIINNVVTGSILATNSSIRNNIVIGANAMYGITTSNTYQNNLISDETIAATDGNQTNVDMSAVFVGYPTTGDYSEDARWQLTAFSPAIGAGSNGEDCGMYGGSTPYVLSGIPWIPTITYISAPSQTSPSAGLEVHIKAQSRK